MITLHVIVSNTAVLYKWLRRGVRNWPKINYAICERSLISTNYELSQNHHIVITLHSILSRSLILPVNLNHDAHLRLNIFELYSVALCLTGLVGVEIIFTHFGCGSVPRMFKYIYKLHSSLLSEVLLVMDNHINFWFQILQCPWCLEK